MRRHGCVENGCVENVQTVSPAQIVRRSRKGACLRPVDWLGSILFAASALAAAPKSGEEFSHRQHAATKLECAYCHTGAQKSERAGFPAVSQCMLCHQTMPRTAPLLQRLADLPKDATPFKVQHHKIPDFVFFSHARHNQAKIECATCHSAVYQTDDLRPHIGLSMKACIECHKRTQAKIGCDVCHELGQ